MVTAAEDRVDFAGYLCQCIVSCVECRGVALTINRTIHYIFSSLLNLQKSCKSCKVLERRCNHPGTEVTAVRATDLDSGANAVVSYAIQRGALDAFRVEPTSGVVTVAAPLDYDRRDTYRVQIVATDTG